jgi:U6 snRNA-associated Sm-like protein LSm6
MKPSVFLQSLMHKKVNIRLNDGSNFQGKMLSIDGFMNVVIQDCLDVTENTQHKTAFLRGNNVLHISQIAQ